MLTLRQILKNTVFENHEAIFNQKLTEASAKFAVTKSFSEKSLEEFLEENFPEMKQLLRDKYDFFIVLCKEMIEDQLAEIRESEYINAIMNINDDARQIDLISQI